MLRYGSFFLRKYGIRGCEENIRLDFPAGVGPAVGSVASPDLDLALDGFINLARAGVMGTSFEDDAGTTVKPGACEGFAGGLELFLAAVGLGLLANFAFSFIISNLSPSGEASLNDLPLNGRYGSEL